MPVHCEPCVFVSPTYHGYSCAQSSSAQNLRPQELTAAQAAVETERARAAEAVAQAEKQACQHAGIVEGLQTQLDAALRSCEMAETASKQATYDREAAFRPPHASSRGLCWS